MDIEVKKEFMNVDEKSFKITTVEERKYQFHKSYSFNVGIAEKFGVDAAIIINNLIFWLEKNKANDCNFYDGYYWTFNSIKAFKILFPFWTERQIKYNLESLEKKGIIKTGNYNKIAYDRTLWYTIIDKSILQFCQMENTDLLNGIDENVKPIPDINTDINTDIKPDIKPDNKQHIYSDEYQNILNHWNNKEIIKHDLHIFEKYFSKNKMKEMLSLYNLNDIIKAIDNYNTVLKDQVVYFFSYKWSLWEFLSRGLAKFVDSVDPLNNFKRKKTIDNSEKKDIIKPMNYEPPKEDECKFGEW